MLIDDALAFISRSDEVSDVAELIADFQALIAKFGFPYSAGGGWASAGTHYAARFYFNSWPEDWLKLYNENAYIQEDPVVMEARRVLTPFLLSEIRPRFENIGHVRELLEVYDAYGWREVFAVPIHGPMSYVGLIALASLQPVQLADAHKAVLESAARIVHYRCWTTTDFGAGTPERAALTARQTDCLRWVAVGKSDSDIASLLGISEATVHFHIEEAKKRLGVRSRVQAVARLVLDGTLGKVVM